jgi:transketolase
MEGVCCEAASLAGHLKLSNLCWIYDNNRVTLDGPAEWSFSEDVAARFAGYGWNVAHVTDANDREMLGRAYENSLKTNDRPTLIIVNSHIGYGSPHKQDSYEAHGEPLGDGVYDHFKNGVGKRGAQAHAAWQIKFEAYKKQFPKEAEQIERMLAGKLPDGWDKDLPSFPADAKGIATRESSGKTLNALAKNIPWLIGGSADLAKSNKTNLTFDGAGDFLANEYRGRNLHFGVREHAMGAMVNGMTLSKLRAYSSTFFNFSDYMRPAMRLGALMEIPAVYIFTHDSVGVGEDGPTHQPIEQLASLRAMPNMLILRPGDANEVVEAYKVILQHAHGPSTLVLTRQAVPTLDRTKYAPPSGVAKGAYVLADAAGGKPDVILMASGSELSLCVEAYEKLKAEGVKARVVSMPSWELFEQQDAAYKASVLPPEVSARVAVEMAAPFGWERYTGAKGKILGMRRFGASAPLKDLLKKFGFSADNVVVAAREVLGK